MFPRPATFVVGAGASSEFNFPVGSELKSQIAKRLNYENDGMRGVIGGDSTIWDSIRIKAQKENPSIEKLNDLFQAARRIARAMPQAFSIDNYIDAHRDNKSVELCGKLAIASAILKSERQSLLYLENTNDASATIMSRACETWLGALQSLAFELSYRENVRSCLNNINIITFNYDRCIEVFLFHAIKNYFHISDGSAAEIIQKMNIIHVYGSVGDLPWQENGGIKVAFGEEPYGQSLLSISERLKTFSESELDDSEKNKIQRIISNSDLIIFMGCGFHDQNLRILRLDEPSEGDSWKTVLATSKSISHANMEVIRKKILNELNWKIDNGPTLRADLACRDILWEYKRVIAG